MDSRKHTCDISVVDTSHLSVDTSLLSVDIQTRREDREVSTSDSGAARTM